MIGSANQNPAIVNYTNKRCNHTIVIKWLDDLIKWLLFSTKFSFACLISFEFILITEQTIEKKNQSIVCVWFEWKLSSKIKF